MKDESFAVNRNLASMLRISPAHNSGIGDFFFTLFHDSRTVIAPRAIGRSAEQRLHIKILKPHQYFWRSEIFDVVDKII